MNEELRQLLQQAEESLRQGTDKAYVDAQVARLTPFPNIHAFRASLLQEEAGDLATDAAEMQEIADHPVRNFLGGAVQGATFGWADELVSALGGKQTGRRMGEAQAMREEHAPGATAASMMAGGMVLPLAPAAGAARAVPGAARGIMTGAARGGLFGALGGAAAGAGLAGEGERLEGAARGTAFGGVGGAVVGAPFGALGGVMASRAGRGSRVAEGMRDLTEMSGTRAAPRSRIAAEKAAVQADLYGPEAAGETIRLRHYSPKLDQIETIDPARQFSGYPGAERSRYAADPDLYLPQSYFYVGDAPPEWRFGHLPMAEIDVPRGSMVTADETTPFFERARAEGYMGPRAASRAQQLMRDAGYEGMIDASGTGVRWVPTSLEGARRTPVDPSARISDALMSPNPEVRARIAGSDPFGTGSGPTPPPRVGATGGGVPRVNELAGNYMSGKPDIAAHYPPSFAYLDTDPALGQRVADLYESAPHAPNDPRVKEAYDAFKRETREQYEFLRSQGVEFAPKVGDPYASSADMVADVRDNNRMEFFLTDMDGFPADHPLAEKTGVMLDGKEMAYNDLFRAVHDYFGHAKEGFQFGPRGEFNAANVHAAMYSPAARPAMLFETHGQNSWVNFGPQMRGPGGELLQKGQEGYLEPAARRFADQKANILPLDVGPPASRAGVPEGRAAEKLINEDQRAGEVAGLGGRESYADTGETIKSAALRLPDGTTVPGSLHGSIYQNAMTPEQRAAYDAMSGDDLLASEGFVTSTGRYVGREEAAEIADRASQVEPGLTDLPGFKGLHAPDLIPRVKTLQKPTIQDILDYGTAPSVRTEAAQIFDTSARGLERSFIGGVPQREVDYLPLGPRTSPRPVRDRFTPERRQGLIERANLGIDRFPSSPYWYSTGQLRDLFVDELGDDGLAAFDDFMRRIAATSPRTSVMNSIVQAGRNEPVMESMRGLLDQANVARTGELPFNLTAPKIRSFLENLRGNLVPPTIDTHMLNILGLEGLPGHFEQGRYGEAARLFNRTATEAGMNPAQFQSSLWVTNPNVMDPQPFLGMVERAAREQGSVMGMKPEQALRRFIAGEGTLGSFAPFLLGAPAFGIAAGTRER